MSASLLRKGLELLDMPEASSARLKRAAAPAQPGKQSLKRTRKKMVVGRKTGEATVKGKTIKSALEEYRKHQAVDHFQENMHYMLNSQLTADSTVTRKVLVQNRGRKSKDRPQEKAEKKQPESTVFTEEDFQKFEREYFVGAGTI